MSDRRFARAGRAGGPLLGNLRPHPDRDAALTRYAQLAPGYDAATRRIHAARQRAIDCLGPSAGETVLDVACGTGAALPELAARVGPSGRVIGIEQSPQMAALARQRVASWVNVTVIECAAEDLPALPPVDALLLCYAHDVLQQPGALSRLSAVARPGARIVATGLCLLPWWAAPVNAWTIWRARNYLTTWHGLRRPWEPLRRYCPDLRVERPRRSTSYVASGTLAPAADAAATLAQIGRGAYGLRRS